MLAIQRRRRIVEELRATGSVTVAFLSSVFQVSEETIRRDLMKLEADGLLVKTYGGAYIKEGMHREVSFPVRSSAQIAEKERIARRCAEMVSDGDTLFLDGSTTALHLAQHLNAKRNLVVITHALQIALALAELPGIEVITLGGRIRRSSLTGLGPHAEAAVSQYYADLVFFSCDGVHREHGITDSNESEAEMRRRMIERSREAVLIADATKFDRTSFSLITEFAAVARVVTDSTLSVDWNRFFDDSGIEFVCSDGK